MECATWGDVARVAIGIFAIIGFLATIFGAVCLVSRTKPGEWDH
jgi:ribose/xylose/arabinose/galactoside ABC-type transport system permease subunit